MIATHAYTTNGRSDTELKPIRRSIPDELRFMLGRLDGERLFSLGLWKIPEGKTLADANVTSDSYIQCGGSAERMTVEVRTVADGMVRHEVIGRSDGIARREPTESISVGGYEHSVYPNEVFDANEAGDLFVSYYETGDVPKSYVKRAINL